MGNGQFKKEKCGANLRQAITRMNIHRQKKLNKIAKWAGCSIQSAKPTHNLRDELSQAKKKYPMYFCLEDKMGYRFNSEIRQMIQDYVNMVDGMVAV